MILPAYLSISAALLTASFPTLSPPLGLLLSLTSLLLRTQGQLSYILVINSPSGPQSLCHYAPIAVGNLGCSLRASDRVSKGGMVCGGGHRITKHTAVLHLPTHTHTHPTKPPPSQPASITLENVVPVSTILCSIPACIALS